MVQVTSMHSSPPANVTSPPLLDERASSIAHQMWERLSEPFDRGDRAVPGFVVGSNAVDVPCPLITAVSVLSNDCTSYVHANRINFFSESVPKFTRTPVRTSRSAIAGQSPQHATLCANFLIQGLDSGKGLFQFTSRRAHAFFMGNSQTPSRESPVIDQLQQEWVARGEIPGSIVLGGRYAVMKFEEVSADELHCTYRLTVRDQLENDKEKTIPLTQVGLRFTDRVLGVEQIEQANAFIDKHNTLLDARCAASTAIPAPLQPDPMIVSYAGIGRNATLIAYREALSRMNEGLDEHGLDAALEDIVRQGRRDRGPRFIHSEEQLEALRDALLAEFARRRAGTETRSPSGFTGIPATVAQNASRLRAQVASHLPAIASTAAEESQQYQPAARQDSTICDSEVPRASQETTPPPTSEVTGMTVDIPELTTPALGATTDSREDILEFVKAHSNDSPLQFFDTVARKNPEVAAFCAVQEKRMYTHGQDVPADTCFIQSMHEGVVFHSTPSSVGMPTLSAADGSSLTDLQARGINRIRATDVVLRDLEKATTPQFAEQSTGKTDGGMLFPHGLVDALRFGRIQPGDESNQVAQKLTTDELVDFIHELDRTGLDLIENLAANNPEAAVFFHFIEHALLFNHATKEQSCNRYEYCEDFSQLAAQVSETGDAFLPVFLEGVRRNSGVGHRSRSRTLDSSDWRVSDNGAWRPVGNKVDVIRHVLLEALSHLHTLETTPGMPIYPLVAYELLAKAVGAPVPQYLKDHENNLLETLANNQKQVAQRRQQIVHAQHETAVLRESEAAAKRKLYDDKDVSNTMQFLLSTSGYSRTLAAESTDTTIPLPINSTRLDGLSAIRLRLIGETGTSGTHCKQEISSRTHCLSLQDNLCWLRSSWLSIFETVSPENLAARLAEIAGPGDHYLAPLIQELAHRYREDPTAFMFEENKGTGAHLGSNRPLGEWLENRLPAGDRLPADVPSYVFTDSVEGLLKDLQLEIAAAYRAKGSHLMSELEQLQCSRSPATSSLPVTLHRAMNLPVLVIEAETHAMETPSGRQVNRFGHLRIAAPVGSEIAKQAESLAEQLVPRVEKIEEIVRAFDDKPILWLEGGHYDLYLPSALKNSDALPRVLPRSNLPSFAKMWSKMPR